MNGYRSHVLAVTAVSFGLLAAEPAHAASLQKVASWGASGVPTYVTMYIYVPDKVAAKPPILVACHACQGNATTYINNIPGMVSAADKNGFIIIVPEATGKNCWDAGSSKSLTHDGGGDTQAIAQMVKYTLTKYNGDPTRVYAMGGSSGAMMTQALLAVYPDIFRAGAARAGVPAGCWADGYDSGQQWSNNCAGGRTTKTAEQWGALVKGMYPSFTGARPRVQLFHGTADATINYNNFGEAIKEWTNVLGLSATPTQTDSPKTELTRQVWKNDCGLTVLEAWSIKDGTHSAPGYDEPAILSFLALDKTGPDPADACGGAGSGGAGGTTGAGGTSSKVGTTAAGGQSSASGAGGAGGSGNGSKTSVGGKTSTGSASGQGTGNGGHSSSSSSDKTPTKGGTSGKGGASASTSQEQGGASNDSDGSDSGGSTDKDPAASSTTPSSATGGASSSPVVQSEPASDGGGCSLAARDSRTAAGAVSALVALALAMASRRRRKV